MSIPNFISMVADNGESLPIYGFIGSSVLCISMMGGTYALMPAYEADLYGNKVCAYLQVPYYRLFVSMCIICSLCFPQNMGPIHGVMMLYSSVAAILGPSMLLELRSLSETKYINDLMQIVSIIIEK
jgi:hypothetical protein